MDDGELLELRDEDLPGASARATFAETLRERGLPLFLSSRTRLSGLVPRCAPILLMMACAATGVGMAEALVARMSPEQVEQPTPAQLVQVLLALALIVGSPLVAWLAAALMRTVPKQVRAVVGVLSIVVTLLPSFVPGVLVESDLLTRVCIVLAILLAGYWGLGSMLAWAGRRARQELTRLGSMVSRVLPVLMLTLLFSFYNAEIWQVTAQITMNRTWAVVGVLLVLGLILAAVNGHDEVRKLLAAHDEELGEVGPELRPREVINLVVMIVLITVIQVTLLAVLVFIFYVGFGVLSVSSTTAAQWIGSEAPRMDGVLGLLPVSRPLVQVSLILAGFSALSFVASAGSDPVYRSAFVEPALDEVRQGLRARDEYLALADETAAETESESETKG